jgi:hypothetical protein
MGMDGTKGVGNDDYRCFDFLERPLAERFSRDRPSLARADEWAQGVRALPKMSPGRGLRWLERIRRAEAAPASPRANSSQP